MMEIQGVIPPMLTPFDRNGEVNYDAHVRNVRRWNKDNLGGYLVLGSNSETPFLSEAEKLKLVALTAEHASSGRIVIAGTGLESTQETIRLTNLAAGRGANAALILTPFFYGVQMNDAALINHFRRIADASKIPVLIYNVPFYTRLMISVGAVLALSEHPNIIGMKDSSGDVPRLAELKRVLPESFSVIMGSASSWYPALTLGVRAGILAVSNFAGNECAFIQALHSAGNTEEAIRLYLRLVPANIAVTATYGVPGLKYASTLLGYEGGGVRSPLLPLDADAESRIRSILEQAGLLDQKSGRLRQE